MLGVEASVVRRCYPLRLFVFNTVRAHQIVDNLIDALIDSHALSANDHVGGERRLVGGTNAREMLNIAAAGAFIETFGITHFADFQWRVHENLDKG